MLWLKTKAALLCAAGCLVWVASARADDRVLVLDSAARPQPGLVSALRIQLTDIAEVGVRHELAAGDTPARIHAAAELCRREGALLVVWAEGPIALADGGQEAVLYAVGEREGRALLQVVHVAGSRGPDMDRSLALKVGEVIRELQRAAAAEREAGTEAAPVLTLAPPPPNAESAAPELAESEAPAPGAGSAGAPVTQRVAPLFGISLLLAAQSGTTFGAWGADINGGASWQRNAWRGSGSLGLAWFPSVSATRGTNRVELSRIAPELVLRSQWQYASFWIGARAGLAWSFISASGHAPEGSSPSADARSMALAPGVEIEHAIGAGFSFALGVDLELRFVSRQFAVNGERVTGLSQVSPLARLGLLWSP
jgi:hypothetical protein